MNIYFGADYHFGMKGDNPIWLDDCFNYFEHVLIPYIETHVQPDDIYVHLGDVFDNRSSIGLDTLNRSISFFEKISSLFSKTILIVGNHDIFQKHSNDITSLNILKHIPNVEIIYNTCVKSFNNKNILFVPWVEDVNKQKEILKSHNVDYVFGHLEIGGCVTNSRKGIVLNTNNSIQSTDFKKAQVFAGHIHIRQDYKNIHYVGTPYHKDRGDIGNPKGLTILNVETGRTRFVENTYSPKFIRVDSNDILDTCVKDLKDQWKNNYVDLVVKSGQILSCDFTTLRETFRGVYKEFNIVQDNTDQTMETYEIEHMSEMKTMNDLVDEYLKQHDVDDDMVKHVKTKIDKYIENL